MANKWLWQMDWCKNKGLAPAELSSWTLAEEAYERETNPVLETVEFNKKSLDYLELTSLITKEIQNSLEFKSQNKSEETHKSFSVSLPLELFEELSEISFEMKTPLNTYIQNILEDSLSNLDS